MTLNSPSISHIFIKYILECLSLKNTCHSNSSSHDSLNLFMGAAGNLAYKSGKWKISGSIQDPKTEFLEWFE